MKTKSVARKQAILDAAADLFQKIGFERASMSLICQRLGYSKATLYNYFPSKEELFLAVVFDATEAEFQAIHEALDSAAEDIGQALERFGRRLLALLFSPPVQAMRRLIASEAGRSGLGTKCYELGAARSQAELAEFLQQAMSAGKLLQADPRIAGLHLVGLLESEWSAAFLFQIRDSASPEEIRLTAGRAVATFMMAYGPATS